MSSRTHKKLGKKFYFYLDKFFYLRYCYNQTSGYFQIPIDLAQKFLLLAVFLKAYDLDNYWYVLPAFGVLLFLTIYSGHRIIKLDVHRREHTFNNQYNPELMKILKNTKNKGKI